MSDPRVLQALLSLQTALQGISQAAGYFYDVKSTSVVLDAVPLEGVPATETPFIVLDAEENGHHEFAGISKPTAIKKLWSVPLRARLDVPGIGPSGSRKRIAALRFAGDLEKAIAADPFRGGSVMYTYMQWPTIYPGLPSQNIVYVEVLIEFMLRSDYGSP